ncbi:hypothetical protein NQ318_001843 [Aromia moschata]|uniref:C2H2-type domain-containing protein n=1 Tax=Aromia moschata TaxID=1265417 RepID=A0AAV8Z1D9_9CUCU|nr:hypothetical protein NQ318_001843 [Aromia moschata]
MSAETTVEPVFECVTVKREVTDQMEPEEDSGVCYDALIKQEIKAEDPLSDQKHSQPNGETVHPEIKTEIVSDDDEDGKDPLDIVCVKEEPQDDKIVLNKLLFNWCPEEEVEFPQGAPGLESRYDCSLCDFTTRRLKIFQWHFHEHRKKFQLMAKGANPKHREAEIASKQIKELGLQRGCVGKRKPPVLMSKHILDQHETPTKTYHCHVCSFQTNRRGALMHHVSIHKQSLVYQCDICPYKTHRRATLVTHKEIHEMAAMRTDYKATMCLF